MIQRTEKLCIDLNNERIHLQPHECIYLAEVLIDYIADDFSKLMSTNIDINITTKECGLQPLKDRIYKRLSGLDDLREALNKHREELK